MEQTDKTLELLEKIEKTNRRQLLFTQIFCGIALVAVLFCIFALVKVNQLLPQIQGITAQMQGVLGNMEQAAGQLAALDIRGIAENVETLVGNVDMLAVSAQDSLKQTMTKLNTIDFETLNKAIEDLSAVIQPLADFFGMFSR